MRKALYIIIALLVIGGAYLFATSNDLVGSMKTAMQPDVSAGEKVKASANEEAVAEPTEEYADFEADYVPFNIESYNAANAAKRWVVYLDDKISALDFIDYDVTVFDSHKHPKLRPLGHLGKAILARTNFFFLSNHENFYTEKEKKTVLFTEKVDGKDMTFVDIRNPEWLRIMIEKKIPHLTNQGFNGLLLEGSGYAVMLERKYPEKYVGMIEALGRFIRTVKQHFPYLKIMLKENMHVTPIARNHVDMVLFVQSDEKGLLSKDIEKTTYEWMQKVKESDEDVEFYSLDLIDMEAMSKEELKALYAKRRKRGLIPYISEEKLEGHYVEPF